MKNKRRKEKVMEILKLADEAKLHGISYTKFCKDNNIKYSYLKFLRGQRRKGLLESSCSFTKISKSENPSFETITIEYKGAKIFASSLKQLAVIISAL